MKRIFKAAYVAAVALIAISCEIADGNINKLTHNELSEYASALYRNNVLLPADMVDFAIELDAYISMTDEQKAEDFRFYRKINEISAGVYNLEGDFVSCIVDTGGASVWEDGAEWTFSEYISRSFVGSSYGRRWKAWITEEVKLIFNADAASEAILMAQHRTSNGNVQMALKSRESGTNIWNLTVKGTDIGSNGLVTEYGSGVGEEGIELRTAPREEDTGRYSRSKIYNGEFYVDIYNGDAKIDWVLVHLRFDSPNLYETSR